MKKVRSKNISVGKKTVESIQRNVTKVTRLSSEGCQEGYNSPGRCATDCILLYSHSNKSQVQGETAKLRNWENHGNIKKKDIGKKKHGVKEEISLFIVIHRCHHKPLFPHEHLSACKVLFA